MENSLFDNSLCRKMNLWKSEVIMTMLDNQLTESLLMFFMLQLLQQQKQQFFRHYPGGDRKMN